MMAFQFLDSSSKVFAAANPFQVSEYVRENVGTHSLRLSNGGAATASLSHRRAGTLDLCRLRYGAQARIVSEGTRFTPRVAIEDTLTIEPLPFASMWGRAARQHHRVGNSERRTSASISFSW